MTPMADVTFTDVAKRYGDVTVIEHLDLHIENGELPPKDRDIAITLAAVHRASRRHMVR